MIIVLDASAAVEIVLNKADSHRFKELLMQSELVLAPDTFPSEITNTFWKYALYSGLPGEKCEKGIDYCIDLVDDYINTRSLCREVFSESVKTGHPAYDLFYLILARRNNACILTKDKKMIEAARKLNIKVPTV
ncbi:MAG: PIN domain nuclease [Smithellaceae bacterium]|jgi:predicted nucleic acid-binding protein|nr:twitching motility protein PilT [Smithella sp. F21]MDD4860870.1 PIN domain nuclease [Smithellaceae bacterium]MDD5415204.1 PIN domain nuclease [Smithellaceae bacterium]HCS76780.1 PIN domain nuclease [Syntrophaceae bacterium]HCX02431.1 PIN domain nuclease [Syntrophaceae bacterium]